MMQLLVLDTETGGLDPLTSSLIDDRGYVSLPAIARALGVGTEGAHGAMRDCEILLECLRRYGLSVETRPPDVIDAEGEGVES